MSARRSRLHELTPCRSIQRAPPCSRQTEIEKAQVVLVVQWLGVGLVIERSLVQFPAGALSSQLGQLSLPSVRGR